jgi:hypothetical protein
VLRGVTLAGCSAALMVAAHAAAGGSAPSPGLTIVLTALLAAAGVALADRRRGFPSILAAVGGSQLGMHVLLSTLGHGHGALAVSWRMAALHAAAAVLTAVLLAGGENAVFAVVSVFRWILDGTVVRPRRLPALGPLVFSCRAATTRRSIVIDVLLRRVHARRGPPAAW